MFQKFTNYLKEVRLEMKKVNWPSRADTLRFTVIVIGISLGVAAILGGFDFIFTSVLQIFVV
jgi:preprotein translocase subunit SecE